MTPGHAYALTRMQARIARRPGAESFTHLVSIGDFGHFLQAAAKAGFSEWLHHLAPDTGAHPSELALRLAFRTQLRDLAGWLPAAWRALPEWLSLAPDLPVIADLLRGQRAERWVARDPRLQPLVNDDRKLDRAALARHWPELAEATEDRLDAFWSEAALDRVPGPPSASIRALLADHLAPPSRESGERLIKTFRRQPRAGSRITAFVGLLRLDFEFLRGQLSRRQLQSGQAR